MQLKNWELYGGFGQGPLRQRRSSWASCGLEGALVGRDMHFISSSGDESRNSLNRGHISPQEIWQAAKWSTDGVEGGDHGLEIEGQEPRMERWGHQFLFMCLTYPSNFPSCILVLVLNLQLY